MKIKPSQNHSTDLDMTPMIDVVFQLISFFMMIINFDQTEADERVKLPKDELARPPKVARQKELVLNVGFNRVNEVKQGDAVIFYSGRQVPVETFENDMRLEAQVYKDRQVSLEEVTVTIRADAEVPTGKIQSLIRLAQEAGFSKFAIKAAQEIKQ